MMTLSFCFKTSIRRFVEDFCVFEIEIQLQWHLFWMDPRLKQHNHPAIAVIKWSNMHLKDENCLKTDGISISKNWHRKKKEIILIINSSFWPGELVVTRKSRGCFWNAWSQVALPSLRPKGMVWEKVLHPALILRILISFIEGSSIDDWWWVPWLRRSHQSCCS